MSVSAGPDRHAWFIFGIRIMQKSCPVSHFAAALSWCGLHHNMKDPEASNKQTMKQLGTGWSASMPP